MKIYNRDTIKSLIEDIISCHNCHCSIENFRCPMVFEKSQNFVFFKGDMGCGAPEIIICPPPPNPNLTQAPLYMPKKKLK